MAHKSGSTKKAEFIVKIGSFDPDPDTNSIKIRIAEEKYGRLIES
jgi:ribosomal protein S16